MSKAIHLASGALNRSDDVLTIELHRPLDSPSFVMIVWPAKASIPTHTQSARSVGGRDGPHVGGGADGTRREDQEQVTVQQTGPLLERIVTAYTRQATPGGYRIDVRR
jgi:hypothetical protein